jgi:uncharacterized protein (TIGR03085 family)
VPDADALTRRERDELCDLLLRVGPSAPTLCEGWTALDLAAHLVVRERDPLVAPGILLGGRWAARVEQRMSVRAASGLAHLVGLLRRPPLVPWRVPGLEGLLNLAELVVHHEDVRRANGSSRRDDRPDLQAAVWPVLGRTARLHLRRLRDVGLVVVRPDGESRRLRKGSPIVELRGEPVELLLYVTGRKSVAEVAVAGSPMARQIVESTGFGV